MKHVQNAILSLILIGIICSCNNTVTEQENEEYVFGVRLIDDGEMVQKYLEYHQNVWPEVEKGFEEAGYKQIRLYRYGNYVTMILKVPKGADLAKMGEISKNSDPKVEEWQNLMDDFQRGLPGVEEDQKWVMLEKIYEFKSNK